MEKSSIQSEISYITKTVDFSSAHFYYLDDWTELENKKKFGPCADQCSHGHNYILHVTLKSLPDKQTGMIINLIDLKEILKDKIISEFDHKNLNVDTNYFKNSLPTTENLCRVIWNQLEPELNDKLAKVAVFEDEDFYCYYKGELNMYYVTRIYKFSASHRLHNDNLSDEENLMIFGKCNSYNAHGHNFKLEVTIKGDLEEKTAMVYDILKMDDIINNRVISLLDHKNLSSNVELLAGKITTGENLSKFIWDRLQDNFTPAKLHKIKLYETDRNYFEYLGGV